MIIPSPSRCFAMGLVVLLAAGSTACTPRRDRFWPDSANGLLAIASPRVLEGDPERLLRTEPIGGIWTHRAILRLSHTLWVGDRVLVHVAVRTYGEYRVGGGWIFRGWKVKGTYGVHADVLRVTSSRPMVLSVSSDEFGNIELTPLAPGESTVTITATMSHLYATRPDDAPTYTDTMVFEVQRGPGSRAGGGPAPGRTDLAADRPTGQLPRSDRSAR